MFEQLTRKQIYSITVLRYFLAFVFLWPFFDKTFGLGFSTTAARAWIRGGSPTAGYLGNTAGWLAGIFQGMSQSDVVTWLFMLGLLGVGTALLLGIGLRIAAVSGSLMMLFIWLSELPLKSNPFLDQHLIYIVLLWLFVFSDAGGFFGFGHRWQRCRLVRQYPWLR